MRPYAITSSTVFGIPCMRLGVGGIPFPSLPSRSVPRHSTGTIRALSGHSAGTFRGNAFIQLILGADKTRNASSISVTGRRHRNAKSAGAHGVPASCPSGARPVSVSHPSRGRFWREHAPRMSCQIP